MSAEFKFVFLSTLILEWVKENFSPEEVFEEDQLIEWADGYGFVIPVERQEDDREI